MLTQTRKTYESVNAHTHTHNVSQTCSANELSGHDPPFGLLLVRTRFIQKCQRFSLAPNSAACRDNTHLPPLSLHLNCCYFPSASNGSEAPEEVTCGPCMCALLKPSVPCWPVWPRWHRALRYAVSGTQHQE